MLHENTVWLINHFEPIIIFDDEKLMDIDKDIGETSKKSKSGKKAKTISTQENDHVKKSRKK